MEKRGTTIYSIWLTGFLCIGGVIGGLVVLFTIWFKIWVYTWQTYQNDELGFSFRFPRSWYMGGTDITKEQFNEKGTIFFWVDRKGPDFVQGETELKRSNGDVVVYFDKNSGDRPEFFDQLSESSQFIKFGNKDGYLSEKIGGKDTSGRWMSQKKINIDLGDYNFGADTLTYTKNNLISKLIGMVEHRIGSTILDSFKFDY